MRENQIRLLIVDDEPELFELYAYALRDIARCTFASTREEVASQVLDADAVLLDYGLPGCRFDELLAYVGDKPVAVATGHIDKVFFRQLEKPFDDDQLKKTVLELDLELRVAKLSDDSIPQPSNGSMVRCALLPSMGIGRVLRRIGATEYYDVAFGASKVGRVVKCHRSSLEVESTQRRSA